MFGSGFGSPIANNNNRPLSRLQWNWSARSVSPMANFANTANGVCPFRASKSGDFDTREKNDQIPLRKKFLKLRQAKPSGVAPEKMRAVDFNAHLGSRPRA
jgi:hypothetical protein